MRGKLTAGAGVILCAVLWSAAPSSASTVWRVQAVPAPSNSTGELLGASCPTAGVCMAVGFSSVKGTGAQSTLAELWSGGHWAIEPTPSPGGSGPNQLTAVSCLSATDCTAFGLYSSPTAYENTLVEHWDGSSWTVQPSPNPAGVTVAELDAGSCAAPTSCTATGLYDKGGQEVPLAEHWNGSTWTIQAVPLPAGATAADLSGGVSCPSATDCTAVGAAKIPGLPANTQPLAERWNGTRWTVQATVTPAGAYNPALRGVSCTSDKHCTAVGGFLNSSDNVEESLVERSDGTTWTSQADAAPANTLLDGVSCTSVTSCTAVGGDSAEHWNGATWTLQPTPIPHNTTKGVSLLGLSCRSATTCTAVGYYGSGHLLAMHE